jgi:hypothetical protein
MKKGKPKPYVKKGGNSKKWMILIVAAIMMFSGLWYVGIANAPNSSSNAAGSLNSSRIIQYNVNTIGDNLVVNISEARPELVVLAGEHARLSADSVTELMNLSIAGVYGSDGEISDAFVFFRFYTVNPAKAAEELKPELDRILVDYSLYRGYIGVQPGDASMSLQAYLLGPENISIGSLVKTLLMEKTSGETKLGFIGFIKNVLPVGPVIKATVGDIRGIYLSGFAPQEQLEEVNKSIPSLRSARYQQPLVIVNQDYNSTSLLNISGVDAIPQGNRTFLQLANQTLEAVAGILDLHKVNYTTRQGVVTIDIPADANLTSIRETLEGLNITNTTEMLYGGIIMPEEVVMEGNVLPIQDNKNVTALLFPNATTGKDIWIGLTVYQIGNGYAMNAQQVG